jgi:hypothetical protein
LVAGCGSGGGGVSINDLAAQIADASCARAVTCKEMPDVATCKASKQTEDYFTLTMKADVASGKVKYDEGLGAACADSIRNETCVFTGFRSDPNNPCSKMFTGTVATGGACFQSAECANGASCNPTDTNCDNGTMCCPGTCGAAPTKGAVGATCQDDSQCNDDLYCASAMSKCAAVITAEGGMCGDDFTACANPMLCDVMFIGGTGTCYTLAGDGQTCDPNKLLPCSVEDQYCDATTMKCTATLALGASCASGQTCVGYASCDTSMMCTALKKSGEACTVDQNGNSNCLGDLGCSTTCQLPTAMACQ